MSTPSAFTRPQRGTELELTIDSLAHGGNGVARLEGYVVFVAGALPGDRVKAVVGKSKKAYAEARAVEVLEPSPDRIAPVADHPGAPWQVLRYDKQLEIKQEQVGDALRRIGKLDGFEIEPIIPAPQQWRYRNKLEYSFGSGEIDGSGAPGELVCGFHAPGRFDHIVPITDCLLASERGNELRERVLAWCRERGLQPWDRRRHVGLLRNLIVREGRNTGRFQVRLVTSPGDFGAHELGEAFSQDDDVSVLWTRTESVGESTVGGVTRVLHGEDRLPERLGDLDLLISPDAFFQTNTEQASVLYALAVEYAALRGHEKVFDLFSGIGSIALTMAPRAREVIGLELVEPAVHDAYENARLNDVVNARFAAGDVRLAMRELVEREGKPDVVVVDPPRAGLSQKIVRRIVETRARRIVYVSCNPTTLAPNAAQLVEAGYELRRIRPVDMFPQTPHIECVALFEAPPGVTPTNPDRDAL